MNTYKTKNPMLEQQDQEQDEIPVPDWITCIAFSVFVTCAGGIVGLFLGVLK